MRENKAFAKKEAPPVIRVPTNTKHSSLETLIADTRHLIKKVMLIDL